MTNPGRRNEPRPTKRRTPSDETNPDQRNDNPDQRNDNPDRRNEPQFSPYQLSKHKILCPPTGETTKYCVLMF